MADFEGMWKSSALIMSDIFLNISMYFNIQLYLNNYGGDEYNASTLLAGAHIHCA